MPGLKGARHMAHRMRTAAEKALHKAYAKGGIEALEACWLDLLKTEGPKEFLRILSLYCPKELQVDDKSGQIHVVGQVPPDPMSWARQMGLPDTVTVDQDTGEVVDGSTSGAPH